MTNLTHAQVIETLEKVAKGMGKKTDKPGTASAGMTFFGQLVDHDITLDATSALGKRITPSSIPNVRTPALDLDCVYGSGPEATPHLYGADKSREGGNNTANFLVMGTKKNKFDLARTSNGTALIGDPRNDENAIVSQIQANFIALHNILMTEALKDKATYEEIKGCAHMGMSENDWAEFVPERNMVFEEVRRFIRFHYQYAIWEELLPAFVDQACLDEARLSDLFGADAAIMPVEFTGAAYRFGHATAQPDYEIHAGSGQVSMDKILGFGPREKPVEMKLFFDIDGKKSQRARPVGTTLGLPLTNLHFIHEKVHLTDIKHDLTLDQSRNLPLRNMIRDRYTYQLASGEIIAEWLNSARGHSTPKVKMHAELAKKGFTRTPLWFYGLQEAEQHGGGKLTGVGGAIVASVFGRLLRLDKTTYWHAHGFEPSAKFSNKGGVLAGMMKYAEANRGKIAHAGDLING
ncbi:peroxidase family protein [uncultured Roseibium sp.]|uniref:peroxidase family protein n=1 Tax=uncultured Roseibium sp. TaxID=1936171 RepID=UPI00260EC408|nr:peroxidase family protein [uncultured Roseibium sp.]